MATRKGKAAGGTSYEGECPAGDELTQADLDLLAAIRRIGLTQRELIAAIRQIGVTEAKRRLLKLNGGNS